MKRFILAALMVICTVTTGNADVLTFEGVASRTEIADGYGGLNWSNMYALNATTYTYESGYTHGLVSGNMVAFNGSGSTLQASVDSGTFDFGGVFLTAAWNNGLNIKVTGFKDGIQLYDTIVTVNTYAPTYFDFNYRGVDSLDFTSYGGTGAKYAYGATGTQFVMDNFTIVPEPSTIILLGAGLAGLAFWRIKRRR
jgi:hypothetical protein